MPGPGPVSSTGEPPGGMFARQVNSLLDLVQASPQMPNLPSGMYLGVAPSWQTGGGPGTGEPNAPAGRPAFYGPGQPTEEFIAANLGMSPQDRSESPLAYTAGGGGGQGFSQGAGGGQYQPRDVGGFFGTPGAYSTNNWRLLGRGPGWIMRNGQLINAASLEARQGLPYGYDTSFSDTAESGTGNYLRYVAPGGALSGRNIYDAYYWPGGQIMGRTRWPYSTNT